MSTSPLSTLSEDLTKVLQGTAYEHQENLLASILAPAVVDKLKTLWAEERAGQGLSPLRADSGESTEITSQITEPTPEQLNVIDQMTGAENSAADWLVVPYQASNNLVDFDYRRWHKNAIVGMGQTFKGRPLIFDHQWGKSEKAAAFIFESKLVHDTSTTEEILSGGGFRDYNKDIVKREGYVWLYLAAAVRKDSETAEGILIRKYQDCSTGSVLRGPIYYCPNCTQAKGRDTTFYEKDKHGDYVCPHLIPSNYMFYIVELYGIEDAEFADYAILDAQHHEAVELSNCNRGALPRASIIRRPT